MMPDLLSVREELSPTMSSFSLNSQFSPPVFRRSDPTASVLNSPEILADPVGSVEQLFAQASTLEPESPQMLATQARINAIMDSGLIPRESFTGQNIQARLMGMNTDATQNTINSLFLADNKLA